MAVRHKILLLVGLLAGGLMLASTAVACTYLVGAAEAVGGQGEVTGYGEIGPAAQEGNTDAVEAGYYMFTYTGLPAEPEFGAHGACHGDQDGEGVKEDPTATPVDSLAKVVTATETEVDSGDSVLVCFASHETWDDRFGSGNQSPVYGTTYAPAHVL